MKNDWTFCIIVPTIIFTVRGVVEAQDCNKTEELMKCVQPMRVLTDDNDFGFVMNKEELDRMCPDLRHGIRCINDYTLRCMTEEKRAHFNKLYEGTTQVIQKLCTPGPYQEEFLHHAPCMKEVTTDYEDCAHKYQQKIGEVHARISEHNNKKPANETSADISGREKELRTVCCSFRDYLMCSQRIVMNKCGEDTAKFTEDFLNQMSFSLIQAHCENYPHGSDQCGETSSSLRGSPQLLLDVVLVMISAFYFYRRT